MKKEIRTILREGMTQNSLGVTVSKPDQELIVMRGIPGSGKSTKAKELAGSKGVIHSTDDVIETQGDYREFFANMIANKDFSPLSKVHSINIKNLINSLKAGISPVILDNTNIKQNEPKEVVKAALEMGLDDKNIKFVDIGTGGLSSKELADRNTHGVPLDKIEAMIASHASQGPLSIASVLGSKDMYEQSDVLYSCVLLDEASKNVVLHNLKRYIPEGWKIFAHHMTINMGALKQKELLGTEQFLKVTQVGLSDMAMAIKVKTKIETKNAFPHVTVAINPDGGKPVMSNEITKWQDVTPFILLGKVTEIKKGS
jgi:predicted kinase